MPLCSMVVEGFGASSCIHSAQVMRLRNERPMRVVIVDEPRRIRAFLPELEKLVDHGMAVLEQVNLIRLAGREQAVAAGAG